MRACPSGPQCSSEYDECGMASVQRMVKCDLDVAMAKGAATEQEFIHALSYGTVTWSAEVQTGRGGLQTLGWAKKGLHEEPQREDSFAAS